MHQLEERTFLNADKTKVVPELSAEARHLLGPAGLRIPEEYARELGLLEDENDGKEDLDSAPVEEVQSEDGGDSEEFWSEPMPEGVEDEADEGIEEARDEGVTYPKDNAQLNIALTLLGNAGFEIEQLPTALDADLLAVDNISMGRLKLIRKYFKPPKEDTDNGNSDNGTD